MGAHNDVHILEYKVCKTRGLWRGEAGIVLYSELVVMAVVFGSLSLRKNLESRLPYNLIPSSSSHLVSELVAHHLGAATSTSHMVPGDD